MGQRTDDLLFAIYEQLVELNSKTALHSDQLSEIERRLAEPGLPATIAPKLDPDYLANRSSSQDDSRASEGVSFPRGELDAAIAAYCGQKQHEVTPQHLEVVRLTLGRFHARTPAYLVAHVTREDVVRWRDSELAAGKAAKTVNNSLGIVSAFFEWCVGQCLIMTNPATGLKLKVRGHAARQRKAFTPEQIKHVFDGLLHGPDPVSAKKWLPTIMLYTGARPEEVAQLRVGDVRQVHAQPLRAGEPTLRERTWVFDFSSMDAGQRRKSESSRRLVPVHPRLWDLGLEYLLRVTAIGRSDNLPGGARERGELLFPELTPGTNGRLAEAPSRWFNRKWLRDIKGISERKLVLYSLRHTVATTLKHQGVEESLIAQLLGHADSSITTGRYGKEYPVERLAEVVGRLDWAV
jgi:integrase